MNAAPLLIAAALIFWAGWSLRANRERRSYEQGVRVGYHQAWCDAGANEAVYMKLRVEVQRDRARFQ